MRPYMVDLIVFKGQECVVLIRPKIVAPGIYSIALVAFAVAMFAGKKEVLPFVLGPAF
jgi:hypothetical protein